MKWKTVERTMEWTARIILAAIVMFVALLLAGCSTKYVPVETVRVDSVFLAKLQKDSIFIKDSVYIKEKGDTVFKEKHKLVYEYVLKTDTLYIERRDSIPVPYPVEKKITRWQQFRLDFSDALFKAAVVYVIYRLIQWIIRRTRKE